MSKSQISLKSNFIKILYSIHHGGALFSLLPALPLIINLLPFLFNYQKAQAQTVIPAQDGTGSVVTPKGNQLDITGGQFSQDGSNLFHSFKQFGLNENQIANFLSNPSIQNIFGRVTGGSPSVINGLIQLSGGNSNLFLMNPSGIVFGTNASLNIPADFTATTANGIGFGNNWLHGLGDNDYAILTGKPNSFAFTMSQPGAIINAGNLGVTDGSNLTLLSGTVASTGKLEAVSGNIIVSAVKGESLVRLSQTGSLLSLEVQPLSSAKNQPQPWDLSTASLAQMLTGGNTNHVTQLIRNSKGEIELKGSSLQINPGDATVKTVNSQNALLSALANLTFQESQLQTSKNLTLLAKDTVRVRDSIENPSTTLAGGNLYIQGDKGIDIFTLNHLDKKPFVSGGDLSLVSDGLISGDAHFASGGKFSILNLQGNGGKFISLFDPIISSEQDVTFGNYEGAALKVESKGNITVDNNEDGISITSPDTALCQLPCSEDGQILANEPALILRAGVSSLEETTSVLPLNVEGTNFNPIGNNTSPANVLVKGNILTNNINDGKTGSVIITAPGNITVQNISANLSEAGDSQNAITGRVSLEAGGDITALSINSSIKVNNAENISRGKVNLIAGSNISIDSIDSSINASTGDTVNNSLINLEADGDIFINTGINSSVTVLDGNNVPGGNINLDAKGDITVGNTINSAVEVQGSASSQVFSGDVNLTAEQNINIQDIDTHALAGSTVDIVAGNVFLEAKNGDIKLTDIQSDVSIGEFSEPNLVSRGGQVNLLASGDIFTGDIKSNVTLFTDSDNIFAGDINISGRGNVTVNNIESYIYFKDSIASTGTFGSAGSASNYISGNVNIISEKNIAFNSINTGVFDEDNSTIGKGGDVRLIADNGTVIGQGFIASFFENTVFIDDDIEAEGGAGVVVGGEVGNNDFEVEGGEGGNNDESTFTNNTIITTGEEISGSVEIRHDGTIENVPFIVGDANINGTVGAINAGSSIISPTTEFSETGTVTQGNIKITFNNSTPDIINNSPVFNIEPNTSIVASDNVSVSKPVTVNFANQPQLQSQTQLPAPPALTATSLSLTNNTPTVINQDGLELDAIFGRLEDSLHNEFKDYLGNKVKPNLKGWRDARKILKSMDKNSGVKSALIYTIFTPESLPFPRKDNNLQKSQDNFQKDKDILEILLITGKDKPIRKKIPNTSRVNVLKVARKFQREVSNPRKSTTTTYLKSAKQLYKWIIAPIEEELKDEGIQHLTFISDAGLRSIPFAALHDGDTFLVEKYSTALMPSISLTNTSYSNIKNAEVLAMGASEFDENNPLPAVPLEIEIISQKWKGKSFINDGFTLENLKSQRSQKPFGIIHLATHAEFSPGKIQNSYIQLSKGKVSLDEIKELGWDKPPVELLTLSACKTALGDKNAELGFAGLAIKVGVKSALGSLWYVNDEGTLGLMAEFYQQLKQAPIKAEALRQSQIAMIKGQIFLEKGALQLPNSQNSIPIPSLDGQSRKMTHPYYWSSFTLIGNPW